MATAIQRRSAQREPEPKCANCGHLEQEHGHTGTRPCLATVGSLIDPDFCPCDEYRPNLVRAA